MINIGAVLMILGVTLSSIEEAKSVPVPQSGQIPPLISFEDGKIGVNFLGFHAKAGLGGFLNGGGLHAEAGTPFGQKAVAGLGGAVGQDGSSAGQLYAGATAGGNVRAAAGLGGAVIGGEKPRTAGGLFSAASAGSLNAGSSLAGGVSDDVAYKVVEKTNTKPRKKPITATKQYRYESAPAESSAVSNSQNILGGFFSNFESPKQVSTATHISSNVGHKGTNTFFEDIFNIPISALSAVSKFLSNTVPVGHSSRITKTVTVS
ncbi:uncharacterized protein LOC143915511 [Arctopsyche grandis]|uniref:uncharacterized protein LOC143915511 n=1 Tax=Arctopsyche grandis TaxID=121162 RepID=UPI00406D796E